MKDDLIKPIKDQTGLTADEVRLLIAYQIRQGAAKAFGGSPEDPTGKTIGALIDSQRKFEADAEAKQKESDRLASEAKAKQDALAAELSKTIQFTVYDKGFVASNPYSGRYEDYVTIKCAYENKGTKDVRAFRGGVEFSDLFGKPIFSTSVTIQDPVKAGQKGTWDGVIKYNQFQDSHVALRGASMENMKIRWVPQSIIFSDGSTIGEQAAGQ
jgi:hypothetical protein